MCNDRVVEIFFAEYCSAALQYEFICIKLNFFYDYVGAKVYFEYMHAIVQVVEQLFYFI